MEEKPKKAFISMNKSIIFIFLLLVVSACEKNQSNPEPIDDVPVNITINLVSTEFVLASSPSILDKIFIMTISSNAGFNHSELA